MRTKTTMLLTTAALLCALCAVLSQIQIPIPPVPISLSLLAVHLCGTLLGVRWGTAAVCCYLMLGAAGLPVFAGFAGGLSVLFGPTGGFLFGYIPCVWIVGTATRRFGFSRRTLFFAMALGTLACYALGAAWFMLLSGSRAGAALAACVLPFIPGDILKIILAVTLSLRLEKPRRSAGLCV